MKKLIFALIFVIFSCFSFVACDFSDTTESEESVGNESLTPATYTVTFKQNGEEDVKIENVSEGSAISEDEIPTPVQKPGYTVTWKEEDLAKLNGVYTNITVTAIEDPKTYTVTYDANGGIASASNQEVTYGEEVTLATATLDGYEFLGWTYNGKTVNDGAWSIDAEEIVLVADWLEIKETFTVIFKQDGEDPIQFENIQEGSSFDENKIPTPVQNKKGYTVKWKDEDLAKLTNINGNVVVTTKEDPKTYTVKYDAGDGVASATEQTVTYNEVTYLATATLEEYEFKGWLYGDKSVLSGEKWTIDADGEITLTADWEQKVYYSVTFIQNGTKKVYDKIEPGATFIDIPATQAKKGYKTYWNEDDLKLLDAPIYKNIVINAVEDAKTFKITFDVNNYCGTMTQTTVEVTYGESYTLPEPSVKAGSDDFSFSYWKYDGEKVELSGVWEIDSVTEEIVLVGCWTSNYSDNY